MPENPSPLGGDEEADAVSARSSGDIMTAPTVCKEAPKKLRRVHIFMFFGPYLLNETQY
jgi:hypothetical protein